MCKLASDVLQIVLDILSDNWNSANTNSLTPSFLKITDQKRYDFNSNQDVIFAQRVNLLNQAPAGVGVVSKHLFYNFNLDIRVLGNDQESHFLNVIDEVKNVLDANIKLPEANFSILDSDTDGIDMSDKTHDLWRFILPIKMIRYNLAR